VGQRRHHYEVALEARLRAVRTPYVSVREVRKALLPEGAALRLAPGGDPGSAGGPAHGKALKSFDFVVYGGGSSGASNLLIEVKGRKIPRPAPAKRETQGQAAGAPRRGRLECWVTQDDVDSLTVWERLFGPEFEAAFLFVYWCDEQPPDALFEEIFEHRGRWYALRAVRLADYRALLRPRSRRWGTVHLSKADFDRVSVPFAPPPGPPPGPQPGRPSGAGPGARRGVGAGDPPRFHADIPPESALEALA